MTIKFIYNQMYENEEGNTLWFCTIMTDHGKISAIGDTEEEAEKLAKEQIKM